MIDLHLYLGFVFITVVLGLIPGPNLALIIANSIAHGPRYGLVTVAGTVSAQVIQLIAVSLGLTALLESLGVWFTVLRWLGVIYLLWLGYRQWRAPPVDLTQVRAGERVPLRSMLPRAAAVSLTNPKVLLFLGALFPQLPRGSGRGRLLLGLGRRPGAHPAGAPFPAPQPGIGRHAHGGGWRLGRRASPLRAFVAEARGGPPAQENNSPPLRY
jgi:threonine/homoserine/homoserine lactone efflux protein